MKIFNHERHEPHEKFQPVEVGSADRLSFSKHWKITTRYFQGLEDLFPSIGKYIECRLSLVAIPCGHCRTALRRGPSRFASSPTLGTAGPRIPDNRF